MTPSMLRACNWQLNDSIRCVLMNACCFGTGAASASGAGWQ